MNELIYLNEYSIPPELCDEIIELFESENENRYLGHTACGINKDIKDTLDFCIPSNPEVKKWSKIYNFLSKELQINLKKYIKNITKDLDDKNVLFGKKNTLEAEIFQIQRYKSGVGKYIYHNDFSTKEMGKKMRVITYLWYLNDVSNGGETEIFGNISIKPEKGKLLLFPSSWTFPHSGKTPYSNDKYIITGWLYTEIY